jgi:uncharacterized damage-inducible protein DinB
MTHYGAKELAASFRTVRRNTIQTAHDIPEDKYGFSPAADSRTVAQTLVHIAFGPGIQMHIHANGIDDLAKVPFMELVQGIRAEEAKSRTKSEIISLLESEGQKVASYLEGLSDTFLSQSVSMPPGSDPATKSRLEMLLSPKEHEMHHRGQLMVVQRMLGITPHLTRQMMERMAQAPQRTS